VHCNCKRWRQSCEYAKSQGRDSTTSKQNLEKVIDGKQPSVLVVVYIASTTKSAICTILKNIHS